jgi:hypothetical protein
VWSQFKFLVIKETRKLRFLKKEFTKSAPWVGSNDSEIFESSILDEFVDAHPNAIKTLKNKDDLRDVLEKIVNGRHAIYSINFNCWKQESNIEKLLPNKRKSKIN